MNRLKYKDRRGEIYRETKSREGERKTAGGRNNWIWGMCRGGGVGRGGGGEEGLGVPVPSFLSFIFYSTIVPPGHGIVRCTVITTTRRNKSQARFHGRYSEWE